jgi:hypothetical protein
MWAIVEFVGQDCPQDASGEAVFNFETRLVEHQGLEAALLIISFLLNLREWRIVRIPGGRRALKIFRLRSIEWCPKTYPFGKIRIGDMVPTKGDEIPGSFSDQAGVLGCN